MYEMKDGTGSLFKNDRKEKETQPDYTGKIKINGEEMQLSAWIKTSKKGTKFMSLSFKPFQNRTDEARRHIEETQKEDEYFGDLPF